MINMTVTMTRCKGLDRPTAVFFVRKATEFPCHITMSHKERMINAKSLLGVLSLGVGCNEEVILTADGQGEELAVAALAGFMQAVR